MSQRVCHIGFVAVRIAPLGVLEQRGCASREGSEEARAETVEPMLRISVAEVQVFGSGAEPHVFPS